MSLDAAQRLVEIAAERELLVLEDNPYGLLRFEGEPLPTLRSLDGGEFVIYLGRSRRSSSRAAPRLDGRAAAGARQDERRQAGRRPVLLVGHPVLRRRVLRADALAGLPRVAVRSCTAAGAT
jgi:2-aminoadipate transaminase